MPRIPAFNSKYESLYHDNSKCAAGAEIPSHDRFPGSSGKPLCEKCKKLDANGK
jgi:hypothetical protein